jgi:hypothetical protein
MNAAFAALCFSAPANGSNNSKKALIGTQTLGGLVNCRGGTTRDPLLHFVFTVDRCFYTYLSFVFSLRNAT